MTLASSGDFLRANDPDVLRRIEAAEAALAAPVIRSATVTLTAANLAALDTVPLELVPAQGAGKIALPIAFYFYSEENGFGGMGDSSAFTICRVDSSGSVLVPAGVFSPLLVDLSVCQLTPNAVATSNLQYPPPASDAVNTPIVFTSTSAQLSSGAIITSSIGAAGSGYTALDELAINDAVIRVDTVGGGGEVLTYTVTNAGTQIPIGAAQETTGGSGTLFTINIDTVDYSANLATLTIKTLYSVMDVA